MKKLFLLLALVCFFGIKINYAQAPDWTRVLQSGTFGVQNGNVVTADANYVYMAGGISGPITFGGSGFTSVGLRDLIISKISNAGTFSWTKQFNAQANGTIIPNAIKTDASGNVYLSCSFTGTATIGTSTMTSDATKNSFLVKFDASGNVTWANSYLSTGSGSTKIAIDGSGNSYLNSKSSKLIKFNSSGAIQWEQSFYDRTIQAIAIYGSNLYIGGALQGSTTFGTINLTPLGGYNTGYLVKADLNGVYSSSVVVGGSTSYDGSTVSDIVMDNSGNLIITGAYQKNLVLGTITITNTPADEYYYNYTYIAKCSNTFSFSWAKSSTRFYNVNREMWNFRLFTDNSNNIYEYGILVNSFNFGTIPVSPNNGQFLVKFDASGIATNAYELQNTTYNKVYITPAGKVLTTGSYNYNGATTYGNLYLNQYSGVMALEWQKNSSGSQSGTMGVNYVKHDALGNTYVQSSVLGDCNYSGTLYTSDYNQTIITKHDVAGNVIWTNQIADLNLRTLYNGIEGPRFTLDKDNNVLTVGVFGTSLTIGSNTFTNQNSQNDWYVAKYTSIGQLAWAVQLNSAGQLEIDGITSDGDGNVIVSGEFKSQMAVLGNTIDAGANDGAFILKLDAAGNLMWVKGFPVGQTMYLAFAGTDGNNNIYLAADIAGSTNNTLTFGTVSTPQTENESTVLVKFDPNGNPQWVKAYGGVPGNFDSYSFPVDIKTDAAGNSYLWGWCLNNAVFGSFTLTNPIGTDYSFYLTKINTSGNVVWAKAVYEQYVGSNWGFNYGDLLDLDKTGNVYVGGHIKDKISIEGTTYQTEGGNDFFVAKYSNSGVFQWIKTIPSNTTSIIYSLSVLNDNVLSIGGFAGMNSTLGTFPITRKGGNSCIIATLGNMLVLNVSKNMLSIASPINSTKTFDIKSNISWTAVSNQTWLAVSSGAGANNATITLTATANTTTPRTATVTVSGTGVASQTITVTQDGSTPTLTLSASTLTIAAPTNSTRTFNITSNISWDVVCNQSWLTKSSSTGTGNATITLTAAANPTTSTRNATITVSGNGVSNKTITVTQDGKVPALTVSSNTLGIASASNSAQTFTITSNVSWTIASNQTWLTANTGMGSDNQTITLIAEENVISSTRTATVTITGSGAGTQSILVTQSGVPPITTFPYNQDFSIDPASHWIYTGGTLNWYPYNSNSIFVDFWNNDAPNFAIITTPTFNFTGLTNPELKFKWSHAFLFGYLDELKIEITNDGVTWTTIWDKAGYSLISNDGALDEAPGTYVQASVNLIAYAGQPTVNIRFNGISGYGPNIYLDDVSIANAVVSAPLATTNPATGIFATGAELNGIVTPNSSQTTVTFEYGLSTSYGSSVNASPNSINGSAPVNVTAFLNGLTLNTIYHYRVKAVSSAGTAYGNDATFTTVPGCANLNYKSENAENILGTYSDLGTNGTVITTNNFDDANSSPQNIGFTFNFNCQNFTQFVLNTNGFIKLGNTAPSSAALFFDGASTAGSGIFNSTNAADINLISPFNHDLTSGTGTPEYRVSTSGIAPNRVCTVQFKNVRDKTTSPLQQFDNINFQVKLYETTNIIEFVYGAWTASANASAFKTSACGIKGSSNLDDQLLLVNKGSVEAWAAVLFANANYSTTATLNFGNPPSRPIPDLGRTFRFSTVGVLSLAVSTNTISINEIANSTAAFTVTSNTDWSASSSQAWLIVNNETGSGNATITLTAAANLAASTRTATVIVSGSGVTAQTITITQDALTTAVPEIVSGERVTIYPNPSNGKFDLVLNNFDCNSITVTISNLVGNVVKEFTLKNLPANYNQEIDLGNTAKGLYFIIIKANNLKIVKTVIIANP